MKTTLQQNDSHFLFSLFQFTLGHAGFAAILATTLFTTIG